LRILASSRIPRYDLGRQNPSFLRWFCHIHPKFHRSSVSTEEITKQSNKPERLSRSDGGCYVLGLVAGQGHHLLLD
jgi:hypothetical protein